MDIDQAANFLIGTILTGLGFIVISVIILFLNNLFSKHWKPVTWSLNQTEYRFQEPELNDKQKKE